MSITRSQIARQLLAEGGAPRKGFQRGGVNEADVEAGLATQTMADFAPSEGGYQDIDMSYTTGNEFNVTPQPPSFFQKISDNIDDRRDQSIQSFVQRSSMKPRSAILSAITKEKLPEELFIDLYREDEMNKGLFSEGLAGGRFDMEKTKNLLDKLEDKAGFDRTKSIKNQLNNMTQTEFDRVFPGPKIPEGGDNETLPLRIRKPITEVAEKEESKGEFDDILRLYGARFADGGEVREGYGLGSIVKKATRAVKKVAKSPIGKAALFAGLGAYGLGAGPFKGVAGSGFLKNDLMKKLLLKKGEGEFTFGNLNPFTTIAGISALAGGLSKQDEEEEELPKTVRSDPEFQNLINFYGGQRRFAQTGGDIEDAPMKKPSGVMMASNVENQEILESLFEKYLELGLSPKDAADKARQEFDKMSKAKEPDRMTAQEGGLMNLGGNEMDLRGGGFVPLGAKEKADDVPARLSKNEFVFTADAVKAAGGGSVDRGADIMYKTMKNLENKVA